MPGIPSFPYQNPYQMAGGPVPPFQPPYGPAQTSGSLSLNLGTMMRLGVEFINSALSSGIQMLGGDAGGCSCEGHHQGSCGGGCSCGDSCNDCCSCYNLDRCNPSVHGCCH
jgi:hypothetical protein